MRLRHLTLTSALACAALAAPAAAPAATTAANEPPDVEISCLDGLAEVGADVFCETDFAFDPDGELIALDWDVDGDGFDDGTGTELTARFASAGDKTVRLRATDDEGATTVATTVVEVYALAAGPAFTASADTIEIGDQVSFVAPEGDDEGDKVYERRWDVDGDGDWDDWGTDNRELSWWYDEPGTYTVRLRVQQDGGDPRDATIATRTITVTEPVVEELPPSHQMPKPSGPAAPQPPAPRATTFTGTAGAVAKPAVKPAAKTAPAATKPAAKKKTCKPVKAKKGKKAKKVCKAPKKKAKRQK